jgi:hypothetical protein
MHVAATIVIHRAAVYFFPVMLSNADEVEVVVELQDAEVIITDLVASSYEISGADE